MSVQPRSADASGPFGEPDLWIGAGPPAVGLQRSLGPGDIPGPFWNQGLYSRGRFWYRQTWARIFDGCWKLHEDGTVTGGDYHSIEYVFGPDDRGLKYHPRCPDNSNKDRRFSAYFRGRWAHENEAFPTREQAQAWVEAHWREDDRAERESTGLPPGTKVSGLGFAASETPSADEPFLLRFSPHHSPVHEVRLEPDSVLVRGGALRGLVRNWSRHLWAYEVTVTAGDQRFVWPLSVQPGEIAPFEIAGWEGPTDPEQIQISVTAELSWHVDPSRAFWDSYYIPLMMEVGESIPSQLHGAVRERYAHVTADTPAGSVSLGQVGWSGGLELVPPTSHLSLRGDFEALVQFAVPDLRGYGAVYDGHGRVVDVAPAPAMAVAQRDAEGGAVRYEEVVSLPHPELVRSHLAGHAANVIVQFDVHTDLPVDGYVFGEPGGDFTESVVFVDEFETIGNRKHRVYGTLHGGFILWIGGAFPSLPMS